MPRIRGEILHIAMTTLEGCDVILPKGLLSEPVYLVKYKNVQFTDEDARVHVYTKGKTIQGSLAKQVYLDDMKNFKLPPNARQKKKVLDLYVHHMEVCAFTRPRRWASYYSVASPSIVLLKNIKWRSTWIG